MLVLIVPVALGLGLMVYFAGLGLLAALMAYSFGGAIMLLSLSTGFYFLGATDLEEDDASPSV
jgi:hypothetical protein